MNTGDHKKTLDISKQHFHSALCEQLISSYPKGWRNEENQGVFFVSCLVVVFLFGFSKEGHKQKPLFASSLTFMIF